MTIFDHEHEPPEPVEGDAAYAVVRAALAGIPLIGSAAVEVLQHVIAPPLARRQQEWMNDIAAAVRQLSSQQGISLDDLRDNPAFIDAVLSATQAAIRTSQQEKRTALLNAALNAGLPDAPEVAVQQMFIALVDRFTEWHLRVLKLVAAPSEWQDADGRRLNDTNSIAGLLEQAYPQLRDRRELSDLIWSDLLTAGLHRTGPMRTMMTSAMAKRTTELGDAFLAFIESPLAE
jgi:hypothetical protein